MRSDATKDFIRRNALQIMGIVIVVLNLWLSTKLIPLVQSIRDQDFRISAIEKDYARKSTVDTGFQHVSSSIDTFNIKLDKLSDKVDRLLGI